MPKDNNTQTYDERKSNYKIIRFFGNTPIKEVLKTAIINSTKKNQY